MTVKCCVSCFVGKTQEQRVSDIKNYAGNLVLTTGLKT